MTNEPGQLSYFFSEKQIPNRQGNLLLVSIAGSIDRATAATFDQLIDEVAQKAPTWVVLYMRDVARVFERTQFPAFARLQKIIREKSAELKVCSLHPDLKKLLSDAGLLRANELSNNLTEALKSLALTPVKRDK